MKRVKGSYPKVREIKPVFYKECEFCDKEFKKEKGFEITDYKPSYGVGDDPLRTYYCCNECAANEGEVKNLIRKRREDFIKNGPERPGTKDNSGL